ncbi:DUF907 domain protein [Aspergillus flavus]|nr:DUF907 domain protein [Aspergillus flavus]
MFISLSQAAPVVQTIALVIIEALMLISVSILRPWMNKKTDIYNISIAAINFVNAIFLLIFSNVFSQPGILTGVMGVVFFAYNAVFSLVLLVLMLIASIYAVLSKNPDIRYQPMRDDRESFIGHSPNISWVPSWMPWVPPLAVKSILITTTPSQV